MTKEEAIKLAHISYSYYDFPEEYKKDKDIIDILLDRELNIYQYLDQELRNDKELLLRVLHYDQYNMEYASDDLKNNLEIAEEYLKIEPCREGGSYHYLVAHFGPKVTSNKHFMMKAVAKNGFNLKYANDELKDDKELVLIAVATDGNSLFRASDRLKADIEVVKIALKKKISHEQIDAMLSSPLNIADQSLQNNKELVIEAIKHAPMYYKEIKSQELKNDKDVKEAYKTYKPLIDIYDDPRKLELYKEFQDDYDVLWYAVTTDGGSFVFASDRLKNDRELALQASSITSSTVPNNNLGIALSYAFSDDQELMLLCAPQNYEIFQYASDRLKSDYDTAMILAKTSPYSLEFCNDSIRKNRNIAIAAINKDSVSLRCAVDEIFRCDKEIALLAIGKKSGYLYENLCDKLKHDTEIIKLATSSFDKIVNYLPNSEANSKDFILELININHAIMQDLNDSLKNDDDIKIAYVKYFKKKYETPEAAIDQEYNLMLDKRSFKSIWKKIKN